MMDIDDEGGQSHYLTRHLQYNSHLRAGSAGPTKITDRFRGREHRSPLIGEEYPLIV
jgi:hypothetical protein